MKGRRAGVLTMMDGATKGATTETWWQGSGRSGWEDRERQTGHLCDMLVETVRGMNWPACRAVTTKGETNRSARRGPRGGSNGGRWTGHLTGIDGRGRDDEQTTSAGDGNGGRQMGQGFVGIDGRGRGRGNGDEWATSATWWQRRRGHIACRNDGRARSDNLTGRRRWVRDEQVFLQGQPCADTGYVLTHKTGQARLQFGVLMLRMSTEHHASMCRGNGQGRVTKKNGHIGQLLQ